MKRRPATVHVSDHAVLRYLERQHDLDLEAVRQHLAGRAMTAAEYRAVAVRIGKIKLVLVDTGVIEDGKDHLVVTTALPKMVVPDV